MWGTCPEAELPRGAEAVSPPADLESAFLWAGCGLTMGAGHWHFPLGPLVSVFLVELIYSAGIHWEPGLAVRDSAS